MRIPESRLSGWRLTLGLSRTSGARHRPERPPQMTRRVTLLSLSAPGTSVANHHWMGASIDRAGLVSNPDRPGPPQRVDRALHSLHALYHALHPCALCRRAALPPPLRGGRLSEGSGRSLYAPRAYDLLGGGGLSSSLASGGPKGRFTGPSIHSHEHTLPPPQASRAPRLCAAP